VKLDDYGRVARFIGFVTIWTAPETFSRAYGKTPTATDLPAGGKSSMSEETMLLRNLFDRWVPPISWSRLVAGNWKSPLVGRDVLIGVLFGVGMLVANYLRVALLYWSPEESPFRSRASPPSVCRNENVRPTDVYGWSVAENFDDGKSIENVFLK
jgi:hypothetical protein